MRRLVVLAIVALCLNFQFAYPDATGPDQKTRYEELEGMFRGDIRYLDVSFYNLFDSSIYYYFRSEVGQAGETELFFESIAAGEYLVYVHALDAQRHSIFYGQSEIQVFPDQLTTASVLLELQYGQLVYFQLEVDLGEKDQAVTVEFRYLAYPYGEQLYQCPGSYSGATKKVVPDYPVWIPLTAQEVEIRLPDYQVGISWEVDWQKRQEVNLTLPTPQISPVEVAVNFLSELPESGMVGRVWVVPIDFSTIQEAIDAAAPGDFIKIRSGVYEVPGLIIDKPGLTIEGGQSSETWIRSYGTVVSIEIGAAGELSTVLRNLTIVSNGSASPVISCYLGYAPKLNLFLEKCLISGSDQQNLLQVSYANCSLKNCTLVGGSVGVYGACCSCRITKSVFLDTAYPILRYRGIVTFDDSVIFWNCQSYPEGARVEDPRLTEWYYPASEDSPCRLEKISARYMYYGPPG